jgi:hypothetical protein
MTKSFRVEGFFILRFFQQERAAREEKGGIAVI